MGEKLIEFISTELNLSQELITTVFDKFMKEQHAFIEVIYLQQIRNLEFIYEVMAQFNKGLDYFVIKEQVVPILYQSAISPFGNASVYGEVRTVILPDGSTAKIFKCKGCNSWVEDVDIFGNCQVCDWLESDTE